MQNSLDYNHWSILQGGMENALKNVNCTKSFIYHMHKNCIRRGETTGVGLDLEGEWRDQEDG